jgi:ABC-type nitrate/sulfonate/bicarbonate transport system substrate-binding protein
MNPIPLTLTLCIAAAASAAPAFAQEPITLKMGRANAAEENYWLMEARPDITPNQGKRYKLEITPFRASDATFRAFEAGQIDGGSASANAVITAASKGLDLRVIASLSLEANGGSVTQYVVKSDSPIKSIADLKGKTVGIVGYRSSIELWARAALAKGGLNPDRDVSWAVVPFPAMGPAVRSGKVDIAGMPQVFSEPEAAKGGLRTLFTSKTGVPFDEELILIIMRPEILRKHPEAVRAFLADLATATKWYLANPREAKQALIDKKIVGIAPEAYFKLPDYKRDPSARPNLKALEQMQDMLIEHRFLERRVDLSKVVDLSLSPAN